MRQLPSACPQKHSRCVPRAWPAIVILESSHSHLKRPRLGVLQVSILAPSRSAPKSTTTLTLLHPTLTDANVHTTPAAMRCFNLQG